MPNPERGRGLYYLRRGPTPAAVARCICASQRLKAVPERFRRSSPSIRTKARREQTFVGTGRNRPHSPTDRSRRSSSDTSRYPADDRKRTPPGRVEDISEKPQTFSVPAEPGILYSRGAPLLSIAAGTTPAAVARRMRASQRLKAVARISRRERRRSCPGDYRAVLGPRQPRCFDLTERLLVFSGNDSRRITR